MQAGRRTSQTCAYCVNIGKPRQLNDLLLVDRKEPVVALCDQCLRSLKYADAGTWKWFREYRARLSQGKRIFATRRARAY
jgi:hypothetical protein